MSASLFWEGGSRACACEWPWWELHSFKPLHDGLTAPGHHDRFVASLRLASFLDFSCVPRVCTSLHILIRFCDIHFHVSLWKGRMSRNGAMSLCQAISVRRDVLTRESFPYLRLPPTLPSPLRRPALCLP